VVAVEGSVLVKRFTRFTEEIFASLISLLYIYESLIKLYQVFKQHPLAAEYCSIQPALTSFNTTTANPLDETYSLVLENVSSTFMDVYVKLTISKFNLLINRSYRFNSSIGPTMKPIDPSIKKNQPNTALLCFILALGTFFIAYYLRQFRNSKFLGRSVSFFGFRH
jgi:HCO3- transporter family